MSARARIGVLALQGAFSAHAGVVRRIGGDPREVRLPRHLDECDALIMPGGESTTMSKLLESSKLFDPIAERVSAGMPVFGTCAGMILLASNVLDGRDDQRSFAAIDIDVRRNAYGRQVDSFETDLTLSGDAAPLHAVFIRAPRIERMGSNVMALAEYDGAPVLVRSKCAPRIERMGSNVMALAEYDGAPVLVRSKSVMAASFHPELTDDDRVHRMFLELVDTVERG